MFEPTIRPLEGVSQTDKLAMTQGFYANDLAHIRTSADGEDLPLYQDQYGRLYVIYQDRPLLLIWS